MVCGVYSLFVLRLLTVMSYEGAEGAFCAPLLPFL
jgi:hypothetical protein